MRLPITLTTAALAVAFAAGPAQADPARPTQQQTSTNGVVVLIGANDYGVVASGDRDEPVVDVAASDALRAERVSARGADRPFFDRGPGYAALSGGASSAEVDWV